LRVDPLSSGCTTLSPHQSSYNWMVQYYLRAEGLNTSWIGTGRFIFSHDLKESDFEEITNRFVAAAQAMQSDGWWWNDRTLTNRAIKRRIMKELFTASVWGRPSDPTTGPSATKSAPYDRSSRHETDPSGSW